MKSYEELSKFHAPRALVPCVLCVSHALVFYVLSCPVCLVSSCPAFLVFESYVPCALRAFMSHMSRALRVLLPHVPRAISALVSYVPCALCGLVLYDDLVLLYVPLLPRIFRILCANITFCILELPCVLFFNSFPTFDFYGRIY